MASDPKKHPPAESATKVDPALVEWPPRSIVEETVTYTSPAQVAPVIEGYEILDEAGCGGMGIVYRARHVASGRLVAIKVIRKDRLVHEESVQRFRREAKAAARLTHPNIVLVYDYDHHGDVHFLVMEFVDGVTLQILVDQGGPLPIAQACDFVRQVAAGLQHAHEQALVHRDIKPANLIVTRAGPPGVPLVKILDMGVARLYRMNGSLVDSLTTLTQDGAVIGTADYIGPEQLENPHDADIRADLYSLGCTFYFLLTGQVPFPGGTLIQKLDRQRWQTPAAVNQLRPEVPAGLVAVVRKLMAKSPEERYQTPKNLLADLDQLARAGEIAAAAPPRVIRESRRLEGHASAVTAVAIAPDGKTILSGGKDRTLRLWDAESGKEIRSVTLPQEVNAVAFAPEPDRVLSASGVSVRVWDMVGGKEVGRFGGHTDAVRCLALVPHDPRVVSGGDDRTLRVWDLHSGREILRFGRHSGGVTCVAVSAGGLVLSGGLDQTLRLWDLRSGEEIRRFAVPKGHVLSAAFSPDGRLALSGHFDTVLRLWEIASGRELRRLAGHKQMVTAGVFAPDGRHALSASRDRTVRLWDLDSGCEAGCCEGHTQGVNCLAWSPATPLAASGGRDTTLRLWPMPG
jgi:WD40 repeat protein/tRNA A-37 threonylcarbamoyl transferase component Bud32